MPEAIAEGTNVRGVISQLAHLYHQHFLIPQGKAEGLTFLRNRFIVHENGLSWANRNYATIVCLNIIAKQCNLLTFCCQL